MLRGLSPYPENPTEGQVNGLGLLGVEVCRFVLHAGRVKANGWAEYDRLIGWLHDVEIKPLPVLNALPSDQPALWGEFARQAVSHYPGVHRWQIGNEMTSPMWADSAPDPKQYVAILKAASGALWRADRRNDVILGGLYRDAADYIRRLYGLGAKPHFDSVAVHPYKAEVGAVGAFVEDVRKVMQREGDGGSSMWITETGWASGPCSSPLCIGARKQARRVRQVFDLYRARASRWNLRGALWFGYQDPAPAPDWAATAGLLKPNGTRKESWKAYHRTVT